MGTHLEDCHCFSPRTKGARPDGGRRAAREQGGRVSWAAAEPEGFARSFRGNFGGKGRL